MHSSRRSSVSCVADITSVASVQLIVTDRKSCGIRCTSLTRSMWALLQSIPKIYRNRRGTIHSRYIETGLTNPDCMVILSTLGILKLAHKAMKSGHFIVHKPRGDFRAISDLLQSLCKISRLRLATQCNQFLKAL